MKSFVIGLFEYLRSVVSDAGIKQVSFGNDFGFADTITVEYGNKVYVIRVEEERK